MAGLTKEKILGQYFSGELIPRLLASLLHSDSITTTIDPMCGRGDMFRPFCGRNIELYGIEIDEAAAIRARQMFPEAKITTGNAFRPETIIPALNAEGYDLVITNPPFVRRETINPLASNGFHDDLATIKSSLLKILRSRGYIPRKDKTQIIACINSISMLSDLSIPSWILCMMLVKLGGQLAMVVPTAWMNREYGHPVVELLTRLFIIDYIIIDANRVWFKDSAQIQTSLVVARRKSTGTADVNAPVRFVRLYSAASTESSLTGALPDGVDFVGSIRNGESAPGFFDVDLIAPDRIAAQSGRRSRLSAFIGKKNGSILSFDDLRINVGQGLRTGANKFFYLKRKDDRCYSSLNNSIIEYSQEFFCPAIKNQEGLPPVFAVHDNPDDVVLYIQTAATDEDIAASDNAYSHLSASLESYIKEASLIKIREKFIPELSAVRTNATKGSARRKRRFWYMLPPAGERHYAHIFVPRINSRKVISRINLSDNKIFIDANFINFWLNSDSQLTEFALFALLNSNWIGIQFEELGSTMGGGALKLDAIQIKKCILPSGILEHISRLDKLGKQLSEIPVHDSKEIIRNIDRIILGSIPLEEPPAAEALETLLNSYISCRN